MPKGVSKHQALFSYFLDRASCYTCLINISIEETITIIKPMLLKNNETHKMQQIITLMILVLSQKYFTFQNKIYQP